MPTCLDRVNSAYLDWSNPAYSQEKPVFRTGSWTGSWLALGRQALGLWNILPDKSVCVCLRPVAMQYRFHQIVYVNNDIWLTPVFALKGWRVISWGQSHRYYTYIMTPLNKYAGHQELVSSPAWQQFADVVTHCWERHIHVSPLGGTSSSCLISLDFTPGTKGLFPLLILIWILLLKLPV